MSLDLSDNNYIDKMKEVLKSSGVSSSDVDLLVKINRLLLKPYPTTANGVNHRLETLARYRVRATNLFLRLKDIYIEKNSEKESKFHSKFSMLAKTTNATNMAMESEVKSKGEIGELEVVCERYNNVMKYVLSLIKNIDSVRGDLEHISYDVRRQDSVD